MPVSCDSSTMSTVSLICTIHSEVGSATSARLTELLNAIAPNVIFLEVPAAAFNDYYESHARSNLESLAVRNYCAGSEVELVPVDLPTPDVHFFDDEAEFLDRIRSESPRYRELKRQERAHVENYGFAYLNSEYNDQLNVDLYLEMEATLAKLRDPRLVENYAKWRELLSQRETVMLENIRKCCAGRSYNGAFLVGAAHRKYVMEKLSAIALNDTSVSWHFPACRV